MIGVLVIPMCSRLNHFLASLLSSDVLIHRVPSAQTLQHTASYFTCVFSPASPTFTFIILILFLFPCTQTYINTVHLHLPHSNMRASSVTFKPPEATSSPAHLHSCAYEEISAISKPDKYLSAILRLKCHWQGVWGGVEGG